VKYLILFSAILLSACAHREVSATNEGCSASVSPTRSGKTRTVRTTAYSHMEDGNRKNALGGPLKSGKTYSAAADWSKYPVGTVFRIVGNGRVYVVDDYGSALVGTEKIDLYVPSMKEMNKWGVRNVEIDVLEMGSFSKSLATLRPRAKRGYIRKMVQDLEKKVL